MAEQLHFPFFVESYDRPASTVLARHWCESVRREFQPRMPEQIPRGARPRQVSEAFLAYACSIIENLSDELEEHEA